MSSSNEVFQINETGNQDQTINDAESMMSPPPKESRGLSKKYKKEKEFATVEEAINYINESEWTWVKIRSSDDKIYYKCKCGMRAYIDSKDCSADIYITVEEHQLGN